MEAKSFSLSEAKVPLPLMVLSLLGANTWELQFQLFLPVLTSASAIFFTAYYCIQRLF